MTIKSYRDLDVWKKAVVFVTEIYEATSNFPREEVYGLTSHIRRASISIPSNIAEGRGKRSTKDFLRFLSISYGSACEVETQLIIAANLKLLSADRLEYFLVALSEIARMLNGLMNSLEDKLSSPESRIPNPEYSYA